MVAGQKIGRFSATVKGSFRIAGQKAGAENKKGGSREKPRLPREKGTKKRSIPISSGASSRF